MLAVVKISVIVPAYNAERYLNQCIDSILAQSFAEFELILINDGSTDTTKSICQEYAGQDARIVFIDQSNVGVEQSIVNAVDLAKGEYLCFVDADDWILPEMFEVLYREIETKRVDLVQCGTLIDGVKRTEVYSSDEEVLIDDISRRLLRPFFESEAMLLPLTPSRWNKIYRADIAKEAVRQAKNSLVIGEDLVYNIMYLSRCKKALVLRGNDYYCYRTNNQSITQRYSVKKRDGYLALFPVLERCAKENGYISPAITMFRHNTICSLMLETLLSDMDSGEKVQNLHFLYDKLPDKRHISVYAKDRPFMARVVLIFIRLKAFRLVTLLTSFCSKEKRG